MGKAPTSKATKFYQENKWNDIGLKYKAYNKYLYIYTTPVDTLLNKWFL